jgi:hypothetical protein
MVRLQNAAGPGTKMPVVKLTVMCRLAGVRNRGELGNGLFLGSRAPFVRDQSRAMRGCFAPQGLKGANSYQLPMDFHEAFSWSDEVIEDSSHL